MGIGKRIRQRRKELGYKQSELAKMIGVSSSAIANYENEISCPKEEILYKLFLFLKCDANFLFQDEITKSEFDNIPFDGYIREMYIATKDMPEKEKQALLTMAKSLKQALELEKTHPHLFKNY